MVWEDVKKLGNLLFDQTKEQKDIVLLKLREVSYNNKKEDAMARLGQAVYSLLESGNESISADNSDINRIVGEIHEIDAEIAKISELMEDLKKQAAGERDTMATEVNTVWKKTKTAFATDDPKESETKAAPPTADSLETETEKKDAPKPPKQAKASTAKKSRAKAKGEEKAGDKDDKGSNKV